MFGSGSFGLGVLLVVLGLAFFLLTPFILRAVPRLRPITQDAPLPQPISLDLPKNEDALLLIEPGGRILHVNSRAREWFGLLEHEIPNLERMARHARPSDTFLGLCAASGQARFTLDQHLVEGSSYDVPHEGSRAILLAVRRPQLAALDNAQSQLSSQTLNIFSEISQTIMASLDLDATIATILESVNRLVQSDFSELNLWDGESERLIPYRYVPAEDGSRHMEKTTERYLPSEGYTGAVFSQGKALLVSDVREFGRLRLTTDRLRFAFRSFLGVPLVLGGSPIGTLELLSQTTEFFSQSDLELLEILSGQAAVALQNAIVHEREQRRAAELAGLARLAQVGSSMMESRELFERLTESIAPLLDAEIFGLLTYDESRRVLAGEVPFVGLPPQFVEVYHAEIKDGTPAQFVWLGQEIIRTEDAAADPRLADLGLGPLVQAAGIRETVLTPLTSGGRSLGYFQVANKRDGSMFDDDDMRLLSIIAGQVAPILENASLIRASRLRTQRAESLRRIASLSGSTATLEEILKFSLLELSRFLQADAAAAWLVDDAFGGLRLHETSAIGLPANGDGEPPHVLFNDAGYPETGAATLKLCFTPDLSQDEGVPSVYRRLSQTFGNVHSLMVVPMVINGRGLGEILLAGYRPGAFSQGDLQSVVSVSAQLAGAVERANLYAQTDEGLQQRVDQLTALTRLSRELNTTQNLKHLLQRVFDEALRTTRADCGAVLLFDLEHANGAAPRAVLRVGDSSVEGLGPLERSALARGEPQIVADYEASDFKPAHPGVRSALVVPVAYQEQAVGLIQLHAKAPNHFDAMSLEMTQALAIQTAIALGNTLRYQEQVRRGEVLERRVEALNSLFETSRTFNLDRPIQESLDAVAKGIRASTPFDRVALFAYDGQFNTLNLAGAAGLPLEAGAQMRAAAYSWENVTRLMLAEYRRGNVYFIPASRRPDVPPLMPLLAQTATPLAPPRPDDWHPGDVLALPLLDLSARPLGLLAVDAPRDNLRPDEFTFETLEIFGAEAAKVVESFHKLQALRGQAAAPQSDSVQNGHPAQTVQDRLSLLLRKDLEQTLAIQQLDERARSIRVGLDIAEIVNRQPDRESVLAALGNQLMAQMGLDVALVAEPSAGGPRLLHQLGALPESVNPQALLGQRNPLRQSLDTGSTILVSNLEEDSDWNNTPLLRSLNAKGFISLPVSSNGHVEAAVLVVSHTHIPAFTKEDEQIYDLIGNQVAIALQNLDLLTETRRRLREVNLLLEFSRQLGSLDPAQILRALVDSARRVMPHAHATMVALREPESGLLVPQAASGYSSNDLIRQIPYRSGEALPGAVYAAGAPRRVDEVDFASHYNLSQENLLRYREATGGRVPVSSMLLPIQAGESLLGVMVLDNFNTPAAFSAEDEALVSSLVQQTALTLENARLFEETRRFTEELEQRVAERTEELAREHEFSQTLLRISTELSSSLDLDHVLNRSLDFLNQTTGSEQASIMLLRPGEPHLVYRAGLGFVSQPPTGGRPSSFKPGEGLASWVIENRRAVIIQDLLEDPRWVKNRGETALHRSVIAAPLTVGEDALGALLLYHRKPNHFTESQLDSVQAAANQFAVAINNGELYRLIRDQAEDLGVMLRAQQVEASRSKSMLEGVADGVLVTDNRGIITLFNQAAEVILDLESRSVVGKSLEDFIGLFGGAAQTWMQTIRRWSQQPADHQQSGEVYAEQIDLEVGRVVSVHLAPVSYKNEFLGTVSIFRDITHQVEVDRLKSEFVATVSHELRTPLTPIKGYVDFLLMGGAGPMNPEQAQFMDIVKINVDRLSILVTDLLDVSRIEAGKVILSNQPVDVREIAEDVLAQTRLQSEEEKKPFTLKLEAEPNLPRAYGDVQRIRQILGNLVDNAYKYTPMHGYIEVVLHQVGDDLQVEVKDNGIGIFPGDRERIFERFFRGENHLVMATAGTGLGLSIVKELVEMHKGRLWLESSGVPGEGSTFSFTLPIYRPEKDSGNNEA